MGWVKENIAESKQQVEGLIICRKLDDGMKYALKNMQDISVLTYSVNFNLSLAIE